MSMGLELIIVAIIFGVAGIWLYKSVSSDLGEHGTQDQEDLTRFYNTKEQPEPAKRGPGRPRKAV